MNRIKLLFRKYGFIGIGILIYNIIRSKSLNHKIRLIRFPIEIRNKHLIQFGDSLTIGRYCRIECESSSLSEKRKKLIFGNNIQINDFVHISCSDSIILGDNVLIASKVFISDSNHGNYSGINQDHPQSIPKDRDLNTSPVLIGDNVWIGENVCILKGVKIGQGSIIAANTVVTKSVPANTIIGGVPGRILKSYDIDQGKWIKV